MGIMDTIFGQVPVAPATPAAVVPVVPGVSPTPAIPATPATPPAAAAPTLDAVVPGITPLSDGKTAPNGVVPDPKATPAEGPNLPKSPLDQYKELWENPKQDPDAPEPKPANNLLDPNKLKEIVSKTTLTPNLTPEQVKAISEGGEGAVAAMQEAMNSTAQQTMVQSTLIANKLITDAVKRASEAQKAEISDLVRQSATTNSLVESNPIFSDPAVKPMVDAAQSQLSIKYPNATPSEITKMTQDYILAMSTAFNPNKAVDQEKVPAAEDWTNFELK